MFLEMSIYQSTFILLRQVMAQRMVTTQIIGGQTVISNGTSSDSNHSSESNRISEEHNLRMQLTFEKSISEHMDTPDQYPKVAVKVISWCKELDDLNCAEEVCILSQSSHRWVLTEFQVKILSELLCEDFRFQVEHTLLNNEKPPQQQLNAAISNFVLEHDGPDNLLVVYYAGHGLFNEKAMQLVLAGLVYISSMYCLFLTNRMSRSNGWATSSATSVTNASRSYIANATWNTAEKALMDDVQGDVLAIFDCCYASDLQRSLGFGNKAFEMLAASNRNTTTPGPGPLSFTRSLTESLRELLSERKGNPFTTYDLLTKIAPKRPVGLEPALHNRRFSIDVAHESRHISIAPLKSQVTTQPKDFFRHYPNASNLTLTFELGHRSLEDKQLERLGSNLPSVFKTAKIPLRRVHWRGIEARNSLRNTAVAMAGISTMRRTLDRVRKRRNKRQSASQSTSQST